MENRREYYRHAIDSRQHMPVLFEDVEGADKFTAEVANLSIGGMCAVSERMERSNDRLWMAIFSLDGKQMRMPARRVYSAGDRPGQCGFQFVPSTDADRREQQEQAIWKYLLEKQRQERKRAKDENRLTA
jgi:c-di-GMP-binding flagellar brake protein YcgR